MIYSYLFKDKEYIVKVVEDLGESANIQFIGRVNGGKGRLPSIRKVDKDSLTLLVDIKTAQKLLEQ